MHDRRGRVYHAAAMPRRLPLLFAVAACFSGSVVGQNADLRSKINDALDMARPALLAHLKEASKHGTRPGELALLALAALHDGVPRDAKELDAALERLAKAKPDQTYDLALRLLVCEACPTFPDRDDVVEDDTRDLLRHVGKNGGFQYYARPSGWDLSNTQYGALGLRAARAMGEKVPDRIWKKMAREVGDQQTSYGGFGYVPRKGGRGDAYASMSAAGIAVLAICREALGDGHSHSKQIGERIDKGWQWFHKNAAGIGSTRERWSYYFHYGLERAAILCDVDKIQGQVDWYSLGARMLVDEQLPGGGWRSTTDGHPGGHLSDKRGDAVPTAFAVLFLRRKFQKLSGPITERVVRLVNIGPRSKDKDVEACAEQLAARGKEAMPDVIAALRSEIEPQRRAAAQALLRITGEDFGYDADKDRDGNRAAVRAVELWFLKNR